MQKIMFIGFGVMGRAIAVSLQKKNNAQIIAIDPTEEARDLAYKMNIRYYQNIELASELFHHENLIIVLAVKPQNIQDICSQLSSNIGATHSIISIMAGVSSSILTQALNTERVIRFMPTIGAKQRESVTGIFIHHIHDPHQKEELQNIALSIANAFGKSYVFQKESDIAAITGLSGSGIAFITAFLDAMILAGIREGIPHTQAQDIAIATMNSVCSLLSPRGKKKASFGNPTELIHAVCSPAGTTIEGIHSLHTQGLYPAVIDAIHTARKKADTIEKNIQNNYTK